MKSFKSFTSAINLEINEEGLRDWFGKSKSKDGKSGWVNVVTGGTCASDEPGEGTPKCVSSSKRSSMTDEERKSAARRKKSADPGQQSKSGAAKPTYVATDVKEESDKKTKGSGTKDACYNKVKSRYSVWPSAYASGALVKCRKVGAANWGTKSESVNATQQSAIAINMKKKGINPKLKMKEDCWDGYEQKGMKKKGNKIVPNCVPSKSSPKAKTYKTEDHIAIAMGKMLDSEGAMIKNQLETIERSVALLRAQIKGEDMQIPAWVQAKITLATENILTCANYMAGRDEEVSEMIQLPAAAASALSTYSKVSSTLSKVSAALKPSQITPISKLFADDDGQQPDEKKTTTVTNQPQTASSSSSSKKSTPKDSRNIKTDPKAGKRIATGIQNAVSKTAGMTKQGVGGYVSMFKPEEVSHDSRRLSSFSQFRQNSSDCQLDEKQIENNIIDKTIHEVAAWQRKEGKNQKGGLNEKGRKSYERENPGSDLKAPQPEGGSRRNSFCARMKGMKAKLTSAKTARDPDSRINKSLRAWNC